MLRQMLYSKIHRATVTDANLEYIGSITVDELLLQKSGIYENQKVDIVNINNGERFQTYVIKGQSGSGEICVNGAGARKVHKGDKIIIIAYGTFDEEEAKNHTPIVLFLNEENNITK
jgi:aspartate 1-decarboxylase